MTLSPTAATTPRESEAPRQPLVQEIAVQLCGFSHCRNPLPPPGPRGGRPFEFCPDRSWPGGKSCKQLAGAEDALKEALGDTSDAVALATVTTEFGAKADAVLPHLGALSAALETMKGRVDAELTAAGRRAGQAEEQAARDRGSRVHAEEHAAEARRQADTAVAEAREHQDRRREAEAGRAEAQNRAKEAELGQARAESAAQAERNRADAAESRAQEERARAASAADAATEALRELAGVAAERDAAVAALDQAKQTAAEAREAVKAAQAAARAAQERADEEIRRARADAEQDRDRLAAAERLRQQAERERRALETSHHEQVGALREELGAARHEAAHTARLLDDHRAIVRRIHAELQSSTDDPAGAEHLRRRMSELLVEP